MKPRIEKLTFITPLFSRGSYSDQDPQSAEIRPASIRGQLHHWLRQLGHTAADEVRIFGSVQKDFGGQTEPSASKVVIRVGGVNGVKSMRPTLPHKNGGQASAKAAYDPGTSFELHTLERLGGLSEDSRKIFERTLEAWLLAGSLGLRTTRGGGSFLWQGAPLDVQGYRVRLDQLFAGAPLKWDLLDKVYSDAETARKRITDTVSHAALSESAYPLGAVRQGRQDQAPSRKTSPLKMTVRKFVDGYRILAIWDARMEVTHNTQLQLRQAITLLQQGSTHSEAKEIGELLAASSLMR